MGALCPRKATVGQVGCHHSPSGHKGIPALLSHVQVHSLPFPHSYLVNSWGLNLVHFSVPGTMNVPCLHLRSQLLGDSDMQGHSKRT